MLAIAPSTVLAQGVGTMTPETHLKMPVKVCTNAGGCTSEGTTLTLDSNWRWTHSLGCEPNCGQTNNCYLGNAWNKTLCPDEDTCTKGCSLDGVDPKSWNMTYGINVDGNGAVNTSFITTTGPSGQNVGGRMYLLDEQTEKYKMFNLLGKEFTFDVDTSSLACGLNGALYFVEMPEDGGVSSMPTNKAGAKYGTGYCDAQCPHDMKWIGGKANMKDWSPDKTDKNVGYGHYGTCCAELDIWEANRQSTQMTVHACSEPGWLKCEGIKCGDKGPPTFTPSAPERFEGNCDKNGCDMNPYRTGAHDFYGPGPNYTINTLKPFTVVTRFPVDANGDLTEMVRYYIQDGKNISNAAGVKGHTSISDSMCRDQMTYFDDRFDVFQDKGGVAGMGKAMGRGMVLVLSLWDDNLVNMTWLDATDPPPSAWNSTTPPPGALRGECPQDSGYPPSLWKTAKDSHVVYSNIRYGEIGSTTGSLSACIALCPSTPPAAFKACVDQCVARCHSEEAAAARK